MIMYKIIYSDPCFKGNKEYYTSFDKENVIDFCMENNINIDNIIEYESQELNNNKKIINDLFSELNNQNLINGFIVNDEGLQFQTNEGKMVMIKIRG